MTRLEILKVRLDALEDAAHIMSQYSELEAAVNGLRNAIAFTTGLIEEIEAAPAADGSDQ